MASASHAFKRTAYVTLPVVESAPLRTGAAAAESLRLHSTHWCLVQAVVWRRLYEVLFGPVPRAVLSVLAPDRPDGPDRGHATGNDDHDPDSDEPEAAHAASDAADREPNRFAPHDLAVSEATPHPALALWGALEELAVTYSNTALPVAWRDTLLRNVAAHTPFDRLVDRLHPWLQRLSAYLWRNVTVLFVFPDEVRTCNGGVSDLFPTVFLVLAGDAAHPTAAHHGLYRRVYFSADPSVAPKDPAQAAATPPREWTDLLWDDVWVNLRRHEGLGALPHRR